MENTGFKRAMSPYAKGFLKFKNAVGDTIKAEDGSILKVVADENWGFWTPGGRTIYYGHNDKGFKKLTPGMGDMKCDSATFGGDPAPGLYKSCYEVQTPAPNAPAPPPAAPANAPQNTTDAGAKSFMSTINWPLYGGIAAVVVTGIVLYIKFK